VAIEVEKKLPKACLRRERRCFARRRPHSTTRFLFLPLRKLLFDDQLINSDNDRAPTLATMNVGADCFLLHATFNPGFFERLTRGRQCIAEIWSTRAFWDIHSPSLLEVTSSTSKLPSFERRTGKAATWLSVNFFPLFCSCSWVSLTTQP
jgi:hypothetical protein